MLNTPNLSWSVALHAVGAARVRSAAANAHPPGRFAALAVVFALQALCGEPVTWVSTGCRGGRLRRRLADRQGIFRLKAEAPAIREYAVRRTVAVVAALAAGALLAAAQLVPTVMAGVRAQRSALATPDFWSLHPFALWETVAPHLFGNYYDAFLADLPWMGALNFGRDPFFYSLYVGPLVLLLAAVGPGRALPPERVLARDRAWCSWPPRSAAIRRSIRWCAGCSRR